MVDFLANYLNEAHTQHVMLQNIPKDKILDVVKQGPTVPNKIVKIVGGDTMLIGAILSTMISTGEVKYSILKVGGSPLYYVPDQESKLEEFISYLNDKDQKTVRVLKDQKIIQDSAQDPLTRVSLKTVKDFAKSFEIVIGEKKELFYRYFLIPREEAELLAKKHIAEQEKTSQEIMVDEKSSSLDKVAAIQHAVSNESIEIQTDPLPEKPFVDLSEEPVVEHKKKKHEEIHRKEKVESEISDSINAVSDKKDFFETIKKHFHEKNLDIISKEKIKKTEYTLVLKNHDSNEYSYCVAKDKKTVNEGDLSTAFVFAHQKKMPCIFLLTGHLSKKAESMTQKEFKDMIIEKI